MAQIEKSVFISYRRTNIYHARATFQDLRAKGYDVFMDYETMNAGDFEQIILNQIKARAHFVVILTPSALERCAEPNDWLRREIETAIDYKRNIIPLMFDGFDWNSVYKYLTGKLTVLSNYNALKIPAEYFDEAMNRLHTRFLNVAIEAVLHPTPILEASIIQEKVKQAINQPVVTEKELSSSEYFERGNQLQIATKYREAIQQYDSAILLNPSYMDAYINRGVAYGYVGDYTRAILDYNEALTQSPPPERAAVIYTNRGIAYGNKGQLQDALADFEQAIQVNPKYANAYNKRGVVAYMRLQYDRAIADYNEAIRLNPLLDTAYNDRAVSYMDGKHDYDHALTDLNEAIRLNTNYADAYSNRGKVYFLKGQYDNAIADFNRALQLSPFHANARANLQLALQKKQNS